MRPRKPSPTFEVRFVAPNIVPEKIPLRAVSDALAAIQDIASGRDPFEEQQVSPEKGIGLLNVKRGSAVYSCVARAPNEAIDNLARLGRMLSTPETMRLDGEELVNALNPLKSLSHVAKSLECELVVTRSSKKNEEPLFAIGRDDFSRISKRLFISGETTIVGRVLRAGGATDMKCFLRIPGRRKGLYCNVKNKKLVQRLGQHLYETIAAVGTAVWIHSSWRIYEFTINDFTQPTLGDAGEAIEQLRDAGLSAWDEIDDPETFVRELRS